ncbi:MAG TPA: hypothetical protein VD835_21060 [Pyrinomonadaceae bacterium]|nr:hypothetical protein [Pyrinomonadaceae bacterium]
MNELSRSVQGEINNLAPLPFPIALCTFFGCFEIYMMSGAAVNEKVLNVGEIDGSRPVKFATGAAQVA